MTAPSAFADDFLGTPSLHAAESGLRPGAAVENDALGFLQGGLVQPAGAGAQPRKTFAERDPEDADQLVLVVGAQEEAEGIVLDPDGESELREQVHAWLDELRKVPGPAKTELMSSGVRDVACSRVIDQMLKRAAKAGTGACSIPLPTGLQVVVVSSELLATVGSEAVARKAHEQAVLMAASRGVPHSARALAMYRSQKHEESMQ
ncbi:hypothetical protein KBW71_00135 [Hydrogenophaga aromaticivorans]|uniref:hypothetical protein n=1 Tax=Hydrogenophaga aromaticivorans TaxID=2610898 RepID=UPI001B38EA21|nr:hypothetical protein [Hydrogenophaga aromaticivorans]MBQ0916857.1 hypothetical protein [Hydrogenophaga aromaticivorans]